ncbi:hypothetical protein [Mucisphaera calidilacus]|uniref:DUF4350 domain-containing protein n=1 Tax=Mucisphaera calidilacus TaxID=2527982 RepID=A0A518BWP1_9BACT|nr:hypothetical protein [Mucisphaera calidilacus]QDU71388.1 hypothetical protein Pan265_12370 [Mucisphaera calidilacus]
MKLIKTILMLCFLVSLACVPAYGSIRLDVDQSSLGFEGRLYPGLWSPVRVGVENTSAEPVSVRLRLPLGDSDGDTALYERVVTVDGNRRVDTWLYGVAAAAQLRVRVTASDGETGVPLGEVTVQSVMGGTPHVKRILQLASGRTGLRAFETGVTRHEPVQVIQGQELSDLPDRAQGLDAIDVICWGEGGGDPSGASWSPAQREALRAWVYGGGELVVILPSAGETWTSSSVRDLLPIRPGLVRRVEARPPAWLGRRVTEGSYSVVMQTMVPREGAWVRGRLDDGSALLVSGVYGMGRVTVLGADVTDPGFRRKVADDSRFRLWHRVFGWQDPVLPRAMLEQAIRDRKISSEDSPVRIKTDLDEDLSAPVDLQRSVGGWLNLLLLMLVGYWLLAGPVSYFVLKRQQRSGYAWLAFAGLTVLFGVMTWSVALFTGSGQSQLRHMSFVDVDLTEGVGRVETWLSVYMPEFNEVSIGFEQGGSRALLSSPGWPGLASVPFLDARAYPVDTTDPSSLTVPSRSASRMIKATMVGPVDDLGYAATIHHGLELVDGLPVGEIRHGLPARVLYVQATYLPEGESDPARALTWRVTRSDAGLIVLEPPTEALRLVRRPSHYGFDGVRSLRMEGFLGAQLSVFPTRGVLGMGQGVGGIPGSSRSHFLAKLRVLTFYELMPPPRFHVLTELQDRATVIRRGLMRDLDLSHRLQPGVLILTGLVEESPLAGRFVVRGREPVSSGVTALRLIVDLGAGVRGTE